LYIADDRELNKLTNILCVELLCIFFWKCGLLSYPCGLMSSWAFVLGDSVLGDFVLGAFVLHSASSSMSNNNNNNNDIVVVVVVVVVVLVMYIQVSWISIVDEVSQCANVLCCRCARVVRVIVPVGTQRQHLRICPNTIHVCIRFLQTYSMCPIAYTLPQLLFQ